MVAPGATDAGRGRRYIADRMPPASPVRSVPPRALILSLATLAIPVVSQLVFPGLVGLEYGFLIWITALLPVFLLAYYRGLRGVAVAAAGGMAILALTQAVASTTGVNAPDSRAMLVAVAVFLAICANLAVVTELLRREREKGEQLALLDALTGLPNRPHLEFMLNMQVAAAARGRSLSVVLFDLDHFKRINALHGHKSGDAALRAFAEVLKKRTRRMDFSGRYGGEEFVAVLIDCPGDGALKFAERVRVDLKNRTFPWGAMTVSAGVATYQKSMASHELLLAAADRALYQAKEAGRDRAILSTVEPSPDPIPMPELLPPPQPQGTGRILVVDDDRDVLSTVVRLLEASGYTVEGVNSPQLALHKYTSAPDAFDLLVTDVLMPDLTGMVMVDLILPHRPDLRVVYMSGYVQRGGVTWAGLPGAVVGFVPKPIEMNDLLGVVRDTMAREPPVVEERAS